MNCVKSPGAYVVDTTVQPKKSQVIEWRIQGFDNFLNSQAVQLTQKFGPLSVDNLVFDLRILKSRSREEIRLEFQTIIDEEHYRHADLGSMMIRLNANPSDTFYLNLLLHPTSHIWKVPLNTCSELQIEMLYENVSVLSVVQNPDVAMKTEEEKEKQVSSATPSASAKTSSSRSFEKIDTSEIEITSQSSQSSGNTEPASEKKYNEEDSDGGEKGIESIRPNEPARNPKTIKEILLDDDLPVFIGSEFYGNDLKVHLAASSNSKIEVLQKIFLALHTKLRDHIHNVIEEFLQGNTKVTDSLLTSNDVAFEYIHDMQVIVKELEESAGSINEDDELKYREYLADMKERFVNSKLAESIKAMIFHEIQSHFSASNDCCILNKRVHEIREKFSSSKGKRASEKLMRDVDDLDRRIQEFELELPKLMIRDFVEMKKLKTNFSNLQGLITPRQTIPVYNKQHIQPDLDEDSLLAFFDFIDKNKSNIDLMDKGQLRDCRERLEELMQSANCRTDVFCDKALHRKYVDYSQHASDLLVDLGQRLSAWDVLKDMHEEVRDNQKNICSLLCEIRNNPGRSERELCNNSILLDTIRSSKLDRIETLIRSAREKCTLEFLHSPLLVANAREMVIKMSKQQHIVSMRFVNIQELLRKKLNVDESDD